MRGIAKKWQDEEISTLVQFASTKTAIEIGMMTCRPAASIYSKARGLGVSLLKKGQNHHWHKLSDLQVEMVRALNEAGFTNGEIWTACFDHVTKSAIHDIVSLRTRREP